MTIRRRLFISNIFMIALPLILTTIAFFAMRAVTISADISPRGSVGSLSYVSESEANITNDYVRIANNVSVYQAVTGEHIIILPDYLVPQDARANRFGYTVGAVLALILAVFLTNYVLTRRISRSVTTPIDILVNGVNEISSGNLTHRIEYKTGDEFDAVCSDFNEMASRLSDMVEQRQADEKSRRELIAGISHDLRTPLTSVKAYIEGFRKGIANTPEMQEKYLDTIQRKTEDIEYIIKQLFMFSQIDIGEFPLSLEIVDIGNELAEMVDGFADEYRKMGLTVSLEENIQGEFVSIDTVQFKNIVQNILGNSVKYCKRADARAEIFCKKADDDKVSIIIEDNGPGVSNEVLTKMFEVFYRGDESRNNPTNGSGLGLAISSKIIERFNGRVRAENAPNGGLTVIITLPIQKGGE